MHRAAWIALMLLPNCAYAQGALGTLAGPWAIDTTSACARSSYELTVTLSGAGPTIAFQDRAGRLDNERVDAQRQDGFTTTTVLSQDVPNGTRWDYTVISAGTYLVRNLSNGQQFKLVRCSAAATLDDQGAIAASQTALRESQRRITEALKRVPTSVDGTGPAAPIAPSAVPSMVPISPNGHAVQDIAHPKFADPVALVTWLIQHSNGHGFTGTENATSQDVFSPGLRTAIRGSEARAQRFKEVPCGLDGDVILDCQECGPVENLQISALSTSPSRTTVSASFDTAGYHRAPKFMTVLIDGAWKVENIIDMDGTSWRRSLDCRKAQPVLVATTTGPAGPVAEHWFHTDRGLRCSDLQLRPSVCGATGEHHMTISYGPGNQDALALVTYTPTPLSNKFIMSAAYLHQDSSGSFSVKKTFYLLAGQGLAPGTTVHFIGDKAILTMLTEGPNDAACCLTGRTPMTLALH